MNKLLVTLFCGALLFGLLSFKKEKSKDTIIKYSKALKSEFGFVRAGQVRIEGEIHGVQAFVMSKGEITNGQYNEFLEDLKLREMWDIYAIAKVDSSKWHSINGQLEPMVQTYHNHESFKNYPVVNITKQGAIQYCHWLTEKLRAQGIDMTFRLPLEAEWMRAACGDDLDAPYSWKGAYLRNAQGNFLANFVQVPDHLISRDKDGKFIYVDKGIRFNPPQTDTHFITARSRSYYPNEYDLYNLNGNVAEMLYDQNVAMGGSWFDAGYDIRNQSKMAFTEASPLVGFRVVGILNI